MNIATALAHNRSGTDADHSADDRSRADNDDALAVDATTAAEHDPDAHSDNDTAPEVTESATVEGGHDNSAVGDATDHDTSTSRRPRKWANAVIYVVLPLSAMLLAAACAYIKWQVGSANAATVARIESVQAAKASTVALLSYEPDKADYQLAAARDLLTGAFRNSYTSLTKDVVIPAAKQKRISAAADVRAVASVTANPQHAVALVFVNQTTIVGSDAPTATTSVVRVTLDKVGPRWLIAAFDPV